MNQTLQRLRELAQESATSSQDENLKGREDAATQAEFAAPLLKAFDDVRNEFVRIAVLKQIWPDEYQHKDDRIQGLLEHELGPDGFHYGLRLRLPHGYQQFEVRLKADGSPEFSCIRETDGQRPLVMEFADQDRWMDYFYKTIADLLEL